MAKYDVGDEVWYKPDVDDEPEIFKVVSVHVQTGFETVYVITNGDMTVEVWEGELR